VDLLGRSRGVFLVLLVGFALFAMRIGVSVFRIGS
jgi:hypothetical protein